MVTGVGAAKRSFRGHTFLVPDDHFVINSADDEVEIRENFWDPKPGEVVIDVGAQYGSYTYTALACGATVIAVEPNPKNVPWLRRGLDLNGWSAPRAQIMQGAIWKADSPYPEELRWTVTEGSGDRPGQEPSDFAQVRMWTLDELVGELNLPRVDWVKVDVEGVELGVIESGWETLQRFRPTLLIEDHTTIYPYCTEILSAKRLMSLLLYFPYRVTIARYLTRDVLVAVPEKLPR